MGQKHSRREREVRQSARNKQGHTKEINSCGEQIKERRFYESTNIPLIVEIDVRSYRLF